MGEGVGMKGVTKALDPPAGLCTETWMYLRSNPIHCKGEMYTKTDWTNAQLGPNLWTPMSVDPPPGLCTETWMYFRSNPIHFQWEMYTKTDWTNAHLWPNLYKIDWTSGQLWSKLWTHVLVQLGPAKTIRRWQPNSIHRL